MHELQAIYARIDQGEFENDVPYPARRPIPHKIGYRPEDLETWKLAFEAYNRKEQQCVERMHVALAEIYQVKAHAKEPKVWSMAWERGYAEGWKAVADVYDELVELI
jgi:DNA-binding PucR family transcriptional regulator